MGSRIFLIGLVLAGVSASAFATEGIPELVTDRPDQSESSVVVPQGHVQLEMGWSHEEDREAGEGYESDTLAENLLRMGVMEGLELRLSAPIHEWVDEHYPGEPKFEHEGWTDMLIGFKKYLWEEQGCLPEAALLFHLTLPTGSDGHSSERPDPNFRFSFSHELNERLSLSYNVGATWETEEDLKGDLDTGASFNWTSSLGYSLTDRLGAFAEIFGDVPLSAPGGPETSFDTGLTLLLTDHFQWDALVGFGISEDAPDWFVGTGFSYRWPR